MSKPQITITLGRTGQKVVKRPRVTSDGAHTDSQRASGRKRSVRERFERDYDTSMMSLNKRLRGNAIPRSQGYNGLGDSRVGQNDLRLKLMRKRMSKRIQPEVGERKKMELRQKMSRNIWAPEGPDRSLVRHISPTKRAGGMLMMDSLRSYTSWSPANLIRESPGRVPQTSRRISPRRNIDEVPHVSSTRLNDYSRTGQVLGSDILDPSRPNGSASITMSGTFDDHKPVTELLSARGSVPKSSYLGEQPLTVSSLLHSLGLGKYAVQFQAEEVDMTALKQMRDCDLKELGIPMGPRKKILLAILPRSKKQL